MKQKPKKKETVEKVEAEVTGNRLIEIKGGGMINPPAPQPAAPTNYRDNVQKMFDELEKKYK